jgi:valyl-tRNA synthetase
MMSSAAAGGDILFDKKLCENGRNFCNKLWNALRLVRGWEVSDAPVQEGLAHKNALSVRWLREKFAQTLAALDDDFAQFRLSEGLLTLYTFIWDDFCSWYLEMIKPEYGQPIDRDTWEATCDIFADMMIALHPFMPFVTEELWHSLRERAPGDDCMVQPYPKATAPVDHALVAQVEMAKALISSVRDLRNQNQIKPKELLRLLVQPSASVQALLSTPGVREMVEKMAFLEAVAFAETAPDNSKSFICGADKYYVLFNTAIDVEAERAKLLKDLEYQRGFERAVLGKLSNERFVAGAPAAVVEAERKKLADAQARIVILEETLADLV